MTVNLGAVNNTGVPVVVSYTVAGTATPTADYTALTGTVSIANGAQTGVIDVTGIVNDGLPEADETVIVTMTGTDNADFTIDAANKTDTVTITDLDVVPPLAPVITAITVDSATPGDGITNDDTLVFSGTAEANSSVEVFIDAASIGTTMADGSGNWSFDHTATMLADANYVVTAQATDASLNTGPLSAAFNITVDTMAPSTPTIDAPIEGDNLVNAVEDDDVLVTGTAEALSTVDVAFDDGVNPQVTVQVTADGAGNWTLLGNEADISGLNQNNIDVTATATDTAGNTSSAAMASVTHDSLAPAVTVTSQVTNDQMPMIMGTYDDVDATGLVVTVNSVSYTLGVDAELMAAGPNWTLDLSAITLLGEGTYNVTATATDAAGNAASDPTAGELVIDLTAPTAPTVTNQTTNNPQPTITGTFDAADSATFTVTVNGTTYTLGTDPHLTTVGNDWSLNLSVLPAQTLPDATYNVVATADDTPGNGPVSDGTMDELVVDSTLTIDAVDDTGPTANEDGPSVAGPASVLTNDLPTGVAGVPTLNWDPSNDMDGLDDDGGDPKNDWVGDAGSLLGRWEFDAGGVTLNNTVNAVSNYSGITASYVFDGTANSGAVLEIDAGAGEDSFQDISSNPTDESASFEIWFKDAGAATGNFEQIIFETGGSGGGGDGTSLKYNDATGLLTLAITDGATTVTNTFNLTGAGIDPTAEFVQVLWTYERGSGGATDTVVLYVNGVARDTQTDTTLNDWSSGNDAGLGRLDGSIHVGGGVRFNGEIAIFRFYRNDVLSSAEVAQNFSFIASEITAIDGSGAFTFGTPFTLASGAEVTINTVGTYTYDPNGKFESLALGESTTDPFTYTIDDGTNSDTATVTVNIDGANDQPSITSGAAFSVVENTTAVTTVTASDVDTNDTLTFSIAGTGADDALFTIDANTGALSFIAAPDFENKLDVGMDNKYDVDVRVDDGRGQGNSTDTQSIQITVTDFVSQASITANDDAAEAGSDPGQFTVDLGAINNTGGDVVVSYTVAGTATSGGTDYSTLSGSVTVANGAQTATIDVSGINDDAVLEGNETVIVTITGTDNADFTIDGANDTDTVTIADNDAAAITIVDVAGDESGNLVFTAVLDNAVQGGPFTVEVSFTDAGATGGGVLGAGVDYVNTTQTLNFAGTANEMVMFTVMVDDDAVLEVDEDFTLSLANVLPASAPLTSIDLTDTATVTIADNDAAAITIVDVAGDESGNLVFTAVLDNAVQGGPFTVEVSFTDAGATGGGVLGAGVDYVNTTQTLNFAGTANEMVMFTVMVDDDAVLEVDEDFTLSLANVLPASAPLTSIDLTDTATGTIQDNDAATADLAVTTQGNESGPTAIVYTVTLDQTNETGAPITFDVNFTGGTATGGTDYDDTVAGAGVISIAAGANSGQLSVPVNDDLLVEGTEFVDATISNPSNSAVTIGTATASAGIIDDEVSNATLVANQPAAAEPASNGQFTVDLGAVNGTGGAVTLTYTITGSATAGTDYTALSGTVNVADGQQTATIDVSVLDDSSLESAETVTLALTGSSNPAFGFDPTSATVTVSDNDTAIVTITNNTDGAEPATNGQFLVDLGTLNNTGSDITVTYTVAGTATTGADYVALSGSAVIATGTQTTTIDVSVLDDSILENAESVILTLTATDNAAVSVDATPATVTIADDEIPPVAQDDVFNINQDTTLNGNVLADNGNGVDADANGDPLTVNTTPVVAPANGALTLNSDGTFIYTPTPGFNGADSFTYEVDDGTGGVGSATVSITIAGATGGGALPTATDDDALIVPDNLLAADFIPDTLVRPPDAGEPNQPNVSAAGAVLDSVNAADNLGFQSTSPTANGVVLTTVADANSEFFGDVVTTAAADRVGLWDAEGLKAYSIRFALNEADGAGADGSRFPLRVEIPGELEAENLDALIVESFLRDRTLYISVNYSSVSNPDLEAVLYSASLANGDPLPEWLRVDSQSGLVTGAPPIGSESLELRIEVQLNDDTVVVRYVQIDLSNGEISELRRVSESNVPGTQIFSSQLQNAGTEFDRAVQDLITALAP